MKRAPSDVTAATSSPQHSPSSLTVHLTASPNNLSPNSRYYEGPPSSKRIKQDNQAQPLHTVPISTNTQSTTAHSPHDLQLSPMPMMSTPIQPAIQQAADDLYMHISSSLQGFMSSNLRDIRTDTIDRVFACQSAIWLNFYSRFAKLPCS